MIGSLQQMFISPHMTATKWDSVESWQYFWAVVWNGIRNCLGLQTPHLVILACHPRGLHNKSMLRQSSLHILRAPQSFSVSTFAGFLRGGMKTEPHWGESLEVCCQRPTNTLDVTPRRPQLCYSPTPRFNGWDHGAPRWQRWNADVAVQHRGLDATEIQLQAEDVSTQRSHSLPRTLGHLHGTHPHTEHSILCRDTTELNHSTHIP